MLPAPVKPFFSMYVLKSNAKTLSKASSALMRPGSDTKTVTWPPTTSERSNAVTPSLSHCDSGTQSESVNASVAAFEAATPPLRAGPAPRSCTTTSWARPRMTSRTASAPFRRSVVRATTISKQSFG